MAKIQAAVVRRPRNPAGVATSLPEEAARRREAEKRRKSAVGVSADIADFEAQQAAIARSRIAFDVAVENEIQKSQSKYSQLTGHMTTQALRTVKIFI